ncbi:hypothetical protein H920_04058 [Fukomys damarensis]|uniref:Uncharacterized protein n=1 Tax=Fukomys damarensis TaxID=885580 RepID=A0A091EGI7_FUKDA|nr:hypothetical protein H920_04058 [Fukomys damarensis]
MPGFPEIHDEPNLTALRHGNRPGLVIGGRRGSRSAPEMYTIRVRARAAIGEPFRILYRSAFPLIAVNMQTSYEQHKVENRPF